MKNDIPGYPNPALTAIAKGPQMQALVESRGQRAKAIYQQIVSKRTGRLARSARVDTFIGGRKRDRWVSRLTIGGDTVPYGASHEFGVDDGDEHIRAGFHDLNVVLNQLGSP
ncbi:hypothetical protein ACIBQ0_17220 [Nocardia nova]|uniref:hypothetical protein n=1 Tax=Nocardia nova TaxID=37330 RepID=UPI0037B526C2